VAAGDGTDEAPQLTRSQHQQQQRQQKQRQQKKRAKRASGKQPASEGKGHNDGEEDLDLGADETADWGRGQRLPPPKLMGATHAGSGRQQRRNGLHGAGNGTDANNEDSAELQMGDRASEQNGEAAAGGAAPQQQPLLAGAQMLTEFVLRAEYPQLTAAGEG
jgi:hypothetical protein